MRPIAVLTEAVTCSPLHAEAHNNLGLAYALLGKLDEANEHLRRAAELKPSSPVINNNYGAMALRMFDFTAAVAAPWSRARWRRNPTTTRR